MKFYGDGIVWDKDKNKKLCKFEKGIYETEDLYIIEKLKELNYLYEHEHIKKKTKKNR